MFIKKSFVFLTTAVLVLSFCFSAAADDFDLAPIRENPTLYTIDVDTDQDVAFIESALSVKDRSFIHK